MRCGIYGLGILGIETWAGNYMCLARVSGCVGSGVRKSDWKMGNFYGMGLPWVGAFTDFGGSGYRNPVQILRENRENHVFLGFWGLV